VAIAVLAIAVVHAERLEPRPARVSEVTDGATMRRGEQAT
jgi:hypothetical protein